MTTTLTSKGQMTIPLAARRAQQWRQGTVFALKFTDGTMTATPLEPKRPAEPGPVDWKALLPRMQVHHINPLAADRVNER